MSVLPVFALPRTYFKSFVFVACIIFHLQLAKAAVSECAGRGGCGKNLYTLIQGTFNISFYCCASDVASMVKPKCLNGNADTPFGPYSDPSCANAIVFPSPPPPSPPAPPTGLSQCPNGETINVPIHRPAVGIHVHACMAPDFSAAVTNAGPS